MEKLNYDSLYKFIVSMGIVLISLPIVFMIMIFSNDKVVFVTQNEISQLSNIAQHIVYCEQNYRNIFLSNIMFLIIISIILILIGIALVIFGIVKWNNKIQRYEDRQRELSIKKDELQIKQLSKEEREEKIKEDIVLENENNNVPPKSNTIPRITIGEYLVMQNDIVKKISQVFDNYKTYEEVRIGNQKFDCIAISQKKYIQLDYIFEIKFFSSINAVSSRLKKFSEYLKNAKLSYYENTDRYAKTVLIIVINNFSEKNKFEYSKKIQSLKELYVGLNSNSHIIISGTDGMKEELEKIKPMEF